MKKVAFLVNRVIKNYDSIVKKIEDEFTYSFDCKLFISNHGGHIHDLASEAYREGYEYLITVGGDGTLNETLNGALSRFKKGKELTSDNYDWAGIKSVKFGVLPAGTGNDFARYHQLKFDLKYLRYLIEKDVLKPLDIGWTTFQNKDNQQTERFFINITDVGLGGHTVQHMDQHKVRWISSSANYMKAILSSFFIYEKSKVRWTSDKTSWEGKIMSFVIANGKYFGSGLGIAPRARMDDGKFSLVTLGNITIWDYIKNLKKVQNSQIMEHEKISYNEATSVTIESLEGKKLPIDLDGDFVGYCPMTLKCIPQTISFLVG